MNAANGQQDWTNNGIGRRKRKQLIPIIRDLLCPHGNEDCLDSLFFKKVELATSEMDDLLRSSCLNVVVVCVLLDRSASSSLSDEKLYIDSVREGTLFRNDSVDILLLLAALLLTESSPDICTSNNPKDMAVGLVRARFPTDNNNIII